MLPRMKNIIIIFFCMFMLMFQATAQNHADVKEIEVSGIVLDSNKDPLKNNSPHKLMARLLLNREE